MSDKPGSGDGVGGGRDRAIRSSNGSFVRMDAVNEDEYFYNQRKHQFKNIREEMNSELSFHEEQITRHQEAINRHKRISTTWESTNKELSLQNLLSV
ncbi:ATPase inhibitor mai-2, mitochondrial-like [Belonocnema kinseyi]|uniref:ATPase inhibitor mai-2, mitochondrial-like n=1 Tax=Belonocnema kinseyi TaxID=2817044 RepID=UPI00143D4AA8|nr:ATPase inhibitor mai-2, mitochondrial-like [Belonocnema kinseyi]